MRTATALCLFVLLGITLALDNRPAVSSKRVADLNGQNLPWTAKENGRFKGKTMDDVKKMLMRVEPKKRRQQPENVIQPRALPTAFDSRTRWPGCVHPVLDQGQCGSCWAFGATESLSDRFCIESNGTVNVVLSPQSLVSCDWEGNMGCGGGIPQLAWEYMEYAGVLTLDCFPYTSGNSGEDGSCSSSCQPGNSEYKVYYAEKFSTSNFWTEYEIQQAIYEDGPVEGTMDVYDDFMSYSSGVYVVSSNATFEGGHAIKIVGWGHDQPSGLDYWIVQNSWGTDWGIQGFFWIERGVDMCGIDHDATAGYASLPAKK